MSAKAQERLHSLSNGGGKAPSSFNVNSNHERLYFDISSLAWNDKEYEGFFENLSFQDKELEYSLVVRNEDKELFITKGFTVPDIKTIFNKIDEVLINEYESSVSAKLRNCIAISGSGEEAMECIEVDVNECKQMSLLIHIIKIGKKLNIKFFTLFMPSEDDLASQKQKAISLYKGLSPSVKAWESSLKDTVLMAIQEVLNVNQDMVLGEQYSDENQELMF